jgi:cytoskeleton protein RodZ
LLNNPGDSSGAKVASGETVFLAPSGGAPANAAGVAGAAPAGPVQLRTTAASWMDVRDAKNQVLLSRIVQPGETVSLDGTLPIRVTIGNAAVTQLLFRGQPIDLAASTRENVARVELK